jgi:carboxymethylenebutenolidase
MLENKSPIAELVHHYIDGAMGRRELMERVIKLTGSMAAAVAALGSFEEMQAQSTPVPDGIRTSENDPTLDARDVNFAGPEGRLFGYLASPRGPQFDYIPGVLVIHENRGLTDHIKDVTRRVAKAGFVALGVDLLSRQGGSAQFPDATALGAAYNRTLPLERRNDILYSLDWLKRQSNVIHDRIGMVGFCAGGGLTWDFVVNFPELAAAVPYYGTPVPTAEDVNRIQTPVLAIYAERDRALTQRVLPVADAMIARQKTFGMTVYEGVGHAFHNDTGAAYNATAATAAWAQTIAWFNKWLRAPRA